MLKQRDLCWNLLPPAGKLQVRLCNTRGRCRPSVRGCGSTQLFQPLTQNLVFICHFLRPSASTTSRRVRAGSSDIRVTSNLPKAREPNFTAADVSRLLRVSQTVRLKPIKDEFKLIKTLLRKPKHQETSAGRLVCF